MRFLCVLAALIVQATNLASAATPAVCFSTCSTAKNELQMVDKATACASGSIFLKDRASCQSCIAENGGDMNSFPEVRDAC